MLRTMGITTTICTVVVVLIAAMMLCTSDSYAKNNGKAKIIFYTAPVKVTNAKGEQLLFEGKNDFPGTMKVHSVFFYHDYYGINVDDSDKFIIEEIDDEESPNLPFVDITIKSPKHPFTRVVLGYVEKVVIEGDNITIYPVEGCSFNYVVMHEMKTLKKEYYLAGRTENVLSLERVEKKVYLGGAMGNTRIKIDYKDGSGKWFLNSLFFFGDKEILREKGRSIVEKGAITLSANENKRVLGLKLLTVNKGKNMFLIWDRVIKAKSYVIYRYEPESKKYKKIAVRNGKKLNYYNIPNARPGEVYMYKVAAKTKKAGKGKTIVKTSYPVWAVAASDPRGNVIKILTNKKKVTGKPGKKIRLKARPTTAGKPLLSENIRWYTSDKRIASVNHKTGKVTLRKKGKCYIWAKAHNGVNSKQIKVVVKGK